MNELFRNSYSMSRISNYLESSIYFVLISLCLEFCLGLFDVVRQAFNQFSACFFRYIFSHSGVVVIYSHIESDSGLDRALLDCLLPSLICLFR